MIVQCDRCQAKYRIPDEKIKGKGVRVKCTKCQNLFTVTAPAAAPDSAPTLAAPVTPKGSQSPPEPSPPQPESPAPALQPPPARPGLDFEQAFRDGQSRTLGPLSRPDAPAPEEPPPAAPIGGGLDWGNISLGAEAEPSPSGGDSDIGLSAHGQKAGVSPTIPPPVQPPPFTPPPPPQEAEGAAPLSSPRAAKGPVEEAPSRGGRGFMTVLLVLIILGGGGYLAYKDPRVKSLLGMGSAQVGGTLVVEDVRVAALTKRNGVTLAVVRGSVRNNTSSNQGMIRVEAQFKAGDGRVLKRVASYCGNLFTDRELETRPSAEIQTAMQNELGQSLANSSIPVGQSVPFMVVLEDAPKDVAQVTVAILSSEGR